VRTILSNVTDPKGAAMSTTLTEAAKASQDQILATVRQSQQGVVDAVAAWAKAVENLVPAAPAIPGTDELPKPEAVVDNAFEFASQLLDAQHEFARRVLAAAAPVIEKSSAPDA
jgi:hypothetical protein